MTLSRQLIVVVALFVVSAILPGRASSHREAPLISGDPQADGTDVYAFMSPDAPDTVTLIASWIPFENPQGGPNFYRFGDNVLYEIKIDNNGDAVEDITYQFRFTTQVRNPSTFLYNTGPITRGLDDPNRNFSQTYTLTRVEGTRTVFTAGPMVTMYDNVGFASTPEYGGRGSGIYSFQQADGGTGLVFAGQTDDAFFLDLRIFDLLYGANLSEAGTDSRRIQRPLGRIAGSTVVPESRLADHRRVGDSEPSGIDDTAGRFGDVDRQLRAGVTLGHAARQRGGDPGRSERSLEREPATG